MDNKTLSVVVLNYNDSETTLNFVKRVNNFENINYIVFNNVTMTNGENTNIELIIK